MWQLQLLSKSRARIPSCVGSCSRTLCNLHCNTSAIVLFKIKSFTQTHNSLNVMLEVIFVLSYLCIPSYPSISVPESNVCLKYVNNNDNIYICYYTLLWQLFLNSKKSLGNKIKISYLASLFRDPPFRSIFHENWTQFLKTKQRILKK